MKEQGLNNLDEKAGKLIGFTSIVVSILLGEGAFKSLPTLRNDILSPIPIIYFAGIAPLLLSIGFALKGYRLRNWPVVPEVDPLLKKYYNKKSIDIIRTISVEMAKAVNYSKQQNEDKARVIEISWYLLIAGLVVVFIFVIVYSAFGTVVDDE